ncbi:MAG: redox-regulated ATPase YchF [Candidatus ainarchaeum sp.]|nr:redox-regulated ATPase YchF [Candidatus ainarchaeum sp.]MDD3976258.1 redox-regulated ATPase YchF [Candidatus ainarchaeum sp.]
MLIGIVGKPNVGKTTFFKAMTLMNVESANYPFTTIDANKGIGFIRNKPCVCKELNTQCNPRYGYCKNHIRFLPVDLIDVAGLVPGASEGRGLGNKFLTDLNMADALIQVIDISGSTDQEGKNVKAGSINPADEIEFLEKEINNWLFGIFKKNFTKIGTSQRVKKQKTLTILEEYLKGAIGAKEEEIDLVLKKYNLKDKNLIDWSDEEILNFTKNIRELSKPIIIAANKIDMPFGKDNLEKLIKKYPNRIIIPCSAESEVALKNAEKNNIIEYIPGEDDFKILKEDINEIQKNALKFIKENILQKYNSTGIQLILDKVVFETLGYMPIYPGGTKGLGDKNGNILPDCFLMPPKSTALDFAFKLHTDFGKNFIKAIDVKTKMLLGKDHKLKTNDVIEIVSGK